MSDFFRNIVKELNDENTTIADDGISSSQFSGCVDTGSYILNAALSGSLYGGVPNNKITVEGKLRPGHATLVAYAISKDGVQWEKPPLNQVSFDGSKETNLVGPEMYNPEGFSVLFEPDDADPQRRYKAFYWDHGNGPTIVIGGNEIYGPGPDDGMHVAFSPDGVLWKVCEKRPVLNYSSDTGH